MKKLIYLDNAATTKVFPQAAVEINTFFLQNYGNPSSIYSMGKTGKAAIDSARSKVASLIGATPEEIKFTSGGSEADNWILRSIADSYKKFAPHIITTKIEHHAILNTCYYLEKQGVEITYLNVDRSGMININELRRSIRNNTVLISVMYANNEIGTLQPVYEIAELAHKYNILFHTDAVQACGQITIDVSNLKVDFLSGSGHKFNGPKGIGFLYIREGLDIEPYIYGGGQESGLRSGTENVPAIAGIGVAAEISKKILSQKINKETRLRDYLIDRILNEVPFSRLNGDRDKRLPNNANFCFKFIVGEELLMLLDEEGVCASSGSACNSSSGKPSHVLAALGISDEWIAGSLRLTLGFETTKQEIDYTIEKIKIIIDKLRKESPDYEVNLDEKQNSSSGYVRRS